MYRSNYNQSLEIKTLEGKTSLDYQLNPFYDIKTGFSYINIKYENNLNAENVQSYFQNTDHFPDTISTSVNEYSNKENILASSYKLNGYVENILQLNENTIINVGRTC